MGGGEEGNASVHDEALNYGDKVCHLILCSFHHNFPCWIQRKAHWRPSAPEPHTYGLFQQFASVKKMKWSVSVCVFQSSAM